MLLLNPYFSHLHEVRPPRSPYLSSWDFFLWGHAMDTVYKPSLPHDFRNYGNGSSAITAIEEDLLEKVWQELDYRLDVCRVTWCAHIECL
jgi:hypothetical protein